MSQKTNNIDIFENMSVPKAVSTMAIPTIIGQLIILFYNMADTFFLGRTNNPLMVAGASLILPVYNISLSLAGLAGIGGGALVSRLLGQKRNEEASRVSSFSIYLGILAAGLFALGVLLFMRTCWERMRIHTLMREATQSALSCSAGYLRCCPTRWLRCFEAWESQKSRASA